MAVIKTSNTEGRSTVATNMRDSAHRNPPTEPKRKQQLQTVMTERGKWRN